jgi:hypothetical protein
MFWEMDEKLFELLNQAEVGEGSEETGQMAERGLEKSQWD